MGKILVGHRQGVAFHHPGTYRHQQAPEARLLGLARQGLQGLLHRQARADQSSELASDERQVHGADAATKQSGTDLATRFMLPYLLHREGRPTLFP